MEQLLLAYDLLKEAVAAIMMLYKNMKVRVHSTDYFDIVTGVLHGNTLASYLFIICLENTLRMSINFMQENGFKLAKESRNHYGRGLRFLQIHPPEQNPYYIAWNEHQVA